MTALGTMKAFSIAGSGKNGEPVDSNRIYRVGEDGKPEILMQGGRQYLIHGENGQVLSNRQITSGNGSIQCSSVVENYVSNVEVSQLSIEVENSSSQCQLNRLIKIYQKLYVIIPVMYGIHI